MDLFQLQTSIKDPTFLSVAYSIILAFVLSTLISLVYQKTFQGLSYSRNFIQGLILGSIVTCIAMQAIGDNMARGFGMMGALSMIRFRASLKDPKDIIFIFSALTVGISCGVYQFLIAIVGSIGFCLTAVFLYYFPFTQETIFDGLLRFTADSKNSDLDESLRTTLNKDCKNFALVTLREISQGERFEFAYQIKLKNKNYNNFLNKIKKIETVNNATLMLQEATVEI